jgi:hypothetical protein
MATMTKTLRVTSRTERDGSFSTIVLRSAMGPNEVKVRIYTREGAAADEFAVGEEWTMELTPTQEMGD